MKSICGIGSALALALLFNQPVAAETGVAANAIRIGQSAPLSGAMAEQGKNYSDGIKLYLDIINAKGGVYGREIDLTTLDDASDPKRAQQNTIKLLNEEKVVALVGYVGAGSALAALPLVEESKTPFLFPYAGADTLRAQSRWVFHLRAGYNEEAAKVVDQLSTVGIKRVAIVYQNDEAGKAGLRGFEQAFAGSKLKSVGQAAVNASGPDMKQAVSAISALKPDAIVLATEGKTSAAFIKAYLLTISREQPQFFGLSDVGATQLHRELGDDAVGISIAQIVPSPWNGKYAVVREYRDSLSMAAGVGRAKYKEGRTKAGSQEPNHAGLEGWIAAKVMVEALKRAGKDLTREKLVAALEGLRNFDVGDFTVDYSRDKHLGSSYVDLSILRAGGKITQ